MMLAPLIYAAYSRLQLLLRGLALDHPVSLSGQSPVMGKTQKDERRRLLCFTPGPMKIQKARLFFMDAQSILAESLRQHHCYPVRVTLRGTEDHVVSSAREPPPHALSEPGVNLSAHRAPITQPSV